MSKLPDEPHELINLALADLEKCENDPKYKIDMSCWHMPGHGGVCHVCLAGAVMAKTFCLDNTQSLFVHALKCGLIEESKLTALDLFRRQGNCDVRAGLDILSKHVNHRLANVYLAMKELVSDKMSYLSETKYDDDPDDFKRKMRIIAFELKNIWHQAVKETNYVPNG